MTSTNVPSIHTSTVLYGYFMFRHASFTPSSGRSAKNLKVTKIYYKSNSQILAANSDLLFYGDFD